LTDGGILPIGRTSDMTCIRVQSNFLTLCNLQLYASNKRLRPKEDNAPAFHAIETRRNVVTF